MKRKRFIIVGAILAIPLIYMAYNFISNRIAEKRHQEWVKTLEHTASDNVQILADTISVDYLNEKRTLALYLPEDYETDSIDYPVVYFLDGQSLFDQKIKEGTEWQVDEHLDSLGKLGAAQCIVVGIYNSRDRLKEYKPFPSTRWYSDKVVSGDRHAAWIVNSVKPWIDARYRTKKEPKATIIGGASLGGLMAYYMLMQYPDVFGGAIVFSPSFWVNEIVYKLHENNANLLKQKIYFNAGELETPTVESVYKMEEKLLKYGVPKEQIKVDVEAGEGHWHMTWRKGCRKVFPWIIY